MYILVVGVRFGDIRKFRKGRSDTITRVQLLKGIEQASASDRHYTEVKCGFPSWAMKLIGNCNRKVFYTVDL